MEPFALRLKKNLLKHVVNGKKMNSTRLEHGRCLVGMDWEITFGVYVVESSALHILMTSFAWFAETLN